MIFWQTNYRTSFKLGLAQQQIDAIEQYLGMLQFCNETDEH